MKKILIPAFLVVSFFAISAMSTYAQHGYMIDKQVSFVANKASVKSRIPNRLETHAYHLKATKGKILSIQLTSTNKDISFDITDAEGNSVGEVGDNKSWEGELEAAGEYKILVYAASGLGSYTLNVKLN